MDENDRELIIEIKKQNKIIILLMLVIVFILSIFTVVVLTNNNNFIQNSDALLSEDENQSDAKKVSLSNDKNYETIYKKLIPDGTPKYSGKLSLSFDDSDKSLQTLVDFDNSFDMNKLNKGQRDKYIWATTNISCEYCCDAKAITFANGEPACACIHSIAMRGLAKYLVYYYNESYSQEMVLSELTLWKARFFPNETIQKYAKTNGITLKVPSTGESCDTEAVPGTKLESPAVHNSAGSCGSVQGSKIHPVSSEISKGAAASGCNPVKSSKSQDDFSSLESGYSVPTGSRLSIHLGTGAAGAAEKDELNKVYDVFGIGTRSKISKNVIKTIDLKIEDLSFLENDTNFQENLAYARTQGYVYPKSIQKTIFSDGSYSIDMVLSGKDATNFILVSRSFRKGTYLVKLEKDGTIAIFNKDGGVKIDANGSTSSWDNHFSCSFKDCELACVTKKFKNPSAMELEKMITDIALKCAGAKAADALKEAYSDIKKVKCASDCADPSVSSSKCARCVISNTAGMLPGAGCVIGLWSILGDMLDPYAECASECGADASSYGSPCKNYQTRKTCIKNFGGVDGLEGMAGESCNDCTWQYDNAVQPVQSCGLSEECVVTPSGPACREKTECKSDDRCVVASRSPSGGCIYTRTPGCDQPDDNVDASTKNMQSSGVQSMDIIPGQVYDPKIAVLNNGFAQGIVSHLSKNGEQAGMVNANLEGLDRYTVLIIPSGGLHGMGTETFMSNIESFVNNGGILVVFAQQVGSDYSSIPGNLEAFGWQQDQSCQHASAAMTSFHPILSGQSASVSSFNVDGFFTKWPENAKIVLTRVKNGFPVLITYPHGNGMVMASTLYSDYSNTLHQQTVDEQILMRDLTAWLRGERQIPLYLEKDVPVETLTASGVSNFSVVIGNVQMDTADFPVFNPGDTVDLPVNVSNPGNKDADRVVFKVYNPAFIPSIINVSASITANNSGIVHLPFETTFSSQTGIWFALYTLYSGDEIIGAGDAGSFALGVNPDELSSYNITLTLRDPDNKIVTTRNISTVIRPGENQTVGIEYTPPAGKYGIWYLEYRAVNRIGEVTNKGIKMFSLSRFSKADSGWTFPGKFSFTITSDTEDFMMNQPATFTFNIYNFGDEDKTVRVTWGTIHHVWRGVVTGGWDYGQENSVLVKAHNQSSFQYTLPRVVEFDRLRAVFYIDGQVAGYADRGIYAVNPQLTANLNINRSGYYTGDEVSLRVSATNTLSMGYDYPVNLSIYDPENRVVFQNSTNMTFSPNSVEEIYYNYTIPENAKPGIYRVSVSWKAFLSWYNYQTEQTVSKSFAVLPVRLQLINKTLPGYLIPGSIQDVSFLMQNTGSSGNVTFNLSLKDNNYTNYTNTSTSYLARGNNITLNFTIPVNESEYIYGNKYTLSYTDGELNGVQEYPSGINVLFDVKPRFKQGENLTFNVTVFNTGKIAEDTTANFSVPSLDLQEKVNLTLSPGEKYSSGFSREIPVDAESGEYDIVAEIGGKEYRTQYYIPPPALLPGMNATDYHAGENINISIENSGGTATQFNLSIQLIDSTGQRIAAINEMDTISAGEFKEYALAIPDQAASGKYSLIVRAEYGSTARLFKYITIKGLEADLDVSTGKKIYLATEPKKVKSYITNGDRAVENATLRLQITGQSGSNGNNGTWERHDMPLNAPDFNTIEFDGSGNLWLGTSGYQYGVLKYSDGKYEKYANALQNGVNSLAHYRNTVYAAAGGPGIAMLNTSGISTLLTTNSGLPADQVYDIDADSYGIWVSTNDGIGHFDGSVWTNYNYSNTGLYLCCHIEADNNGGVWIGGGNWIHFNGDTWEIYNSTNIDGNFIGQLHQIKVDNFNNTYFMGLTDMGMPTKIVRFNGTHWTKEPDVCYYSEWFGSGWNYIADIDVAPDGTLWAACETDGVYSLNTTGRFHYTKSNSGLQTNEFTSVRADADKVVFGAKETLSYMSYNTILSIYNGTWTVYNHSNSNIPSRNQPWNSNLISTIEFSPDGTIWIGHKDGFSKLEDGMFTNYYNSGTINSNDVYSMLASPSGDMWFGGYTSMDKFNGSWGGFSSKDSFVPNGWYPKTLLADSEGRLWAGIDGYGILMYNGTGWTQYYRDSNLNGVYFVSSYDIYDNIMLLAQDSFGAIIAVDDTAQKYVFNGNSWSQHSTDSNVCIPAQVIIDNSDNLWFIDGECSTDGIWKRDTAGEETNYLQGEYIDSLTTDSSGRLWAANINQTRECIPGIEGWDCITTSSRIRLFVYDGTTWTEFESENYGESLYQLNQIKSDSTGKLWITTNIGMFSFAPGTGTGPSGPLWEDVRTVNLSSGETRTSETNAGTLGNAAGKFLLRGILSSSTGQIIDEKEYSFYAVQGNTSLETSLDKKVYRPDETVVLNGRAGNNASESLDNASIKVEVDGEEIYNQSDVSISAGSYFDFSTDIAADEGDHSIRTEITQAGNSLAFVSDDFKVKSPLLEADIDDIPAIVGMAPFFIDVSLNNTGEVNASVNVSIDGSESADGLQSASLMPGEIKLLRFEKQINENKTIYVNFSGDLEDSYPNEVVFGESVNVSLNASRSYMPGKILIPYSIENNGLLGVEFNLTFRLDSDDMTIENPLEIILPAGNNATGLLSYNLAAGEYVLSYSSDYGNGSKGFTVAPAGAEIKDLNISKLEGTLVVNSTIYNSGGERFSGNVRLGSEFYQNGSQIDISPGEEVNLSYMIDTRNVSEGRYAIDLEVLKDGIQVTNKSENVYLKPEFVFISIPELVFSVGETQKEVEVVVRNKGTAGGLAEVNMTLAGIETQSSSAWLLPGEETSVPFNAIIPDDLEEKNYKMFYEMNGIRNYTTFFVNGAKISVNASLDKFFYNDGENATLTMDVINEKNVPLSLQARVQFNGFENTTGFDLPASGSYTLRLEVPVNFTGDSKMLYSVYTATGRSLYINSMFVNQMPPAENGIIIYTDKQVYNVGDTATITINAARAGFLNLTGPKYFNHSGYVDPGTSTLDFEIRQLLTGTYYIRYTFDNISASYPFDVSGYSAKIIESTLDKRSYSSGETIRMNFTIEASRSFNGTLSISILDPDGTQIDQFDFDRSFIAGENKLEVNGTLKADISGLYVIVPKIYTNLNGHSRVIIVSGSEYFDVLTSGPAPVISPTPTASPTPTSVTPPGVHIESSSEGTDSSGVITSEPASNIITSETRERDILAGTSVTYTFSALEHGIYELIVKSSGSQNNVAIRIEALKGTPKVATVSGPGIIYKYVNIWAGTKNINEVLIRFRVENSWIKASGISEGDVRMVVWDDGKWTELETVETSRDAVYTYYEAKAPHLSSFAINGLKSMEVPEAKTQVTGREAAATTSPPMQSSVNLNWILYIVIVLGIIALVYTLVMKKKI